MRKFYVVTVILSFITSFSSCKTSYHISENYQIQCDKTTDESSYSVTINYESNNNLIDIETVKQNAIDGILFRGITGNNECVAQKAILDKPKSEISNTIFYKQLYGNNKNYNKYITNISKVKDNLLETIKDKKLYKHIYRVDINKELLRKDLITQGLLKPLTSGF